MNKHACSSSFNNENIIRLIQLYEFHRVLWYSTLTDYRNNDLCQDAWKAISNELKIPIGELKKKMTTLLASHTSIIIVDMDCLDMRNRYCKLVYESPVPKNLNVTDSLSLAILSTRTDRKSDSESESESSRPPNKRIKTNDVNSDPRFEALIHQVSHLTNCLQYYLPINTALPSTSNTLLPSTSKACPTDSSEFLVKPNSNQLNLGEVFTVTDNNKVIKNASQSRLESLVKLQHFGTEEWKEVKYSKVLQNFLAKPGFIELKINDELCHLNKGKDYLANTEKTLAGLTNGLLEHKEIVRSNLQEIVNWSNNSSSDLTPENLFNKIMTVFGPNTQYYKNMEQIVQVVCGKRTECIEIRRERILSEISNKNLQATLRKLPPSAEHLFEHNSLLPVIQSLGGTSVWLNMPTYLKENKIPKKRQYEPATATSIYHQSSQGNRSTAYRGNKKNSNKKFKKEQRGSNSSFRPKEKK
ncbi:unnamed protein product [Parnassius mnemosyne]|uniref:MADF domain-containing protein n=1 Tax=Parnassius mnemosyne TaxID=213953 RepID=A0AAV1KUN6_9NEOP